MALPVLVTIFWRRCWRNMLLEVEVGSARLQSIRSFAVGLVVILAVSGFIFGRMWELA